MSWSWPRFFFFFLMPIVIPIALFLHYTYKWWTDYADKNRVIFVLLGIIYVPLSLIMAASFDGWSGLAK
jgi:uncharacterized membrane protein